MRVTMTLALVLLASACDRGSAPGGRDELATASSSRGPDPLVMRVPTAGGQARIVSYPNVDSTVWTADASVPALDRILAFDDHDGLIAFVDRRGRAGRIDLNAGTVSMSSRDRLRSVTSVNGSAIFGVAEDGTVHRFNPVGEWSYEPPSPAREVYPQRDGSILILSPQGGDGPMLRRVHPPDTDITDSLRLPAVGRSLQTSVGDRVYFAHDNALLPVQTRRLTVGPAVGQIGSDPISLAVTPSGDRLFATSESDARLRVIDRYQGRVATLELPSQPGRLRMDPLGRYVLVQNSTADSIWVMAIGNDRIVATLRSAWRSDLPMVGPDGAIIALQGNDVAVFEPGTFEERRRIRGGGADFWFSFWWSGFKPRARVAMVDDSLLFARTEPDTDTVVIVLPPSDTATVQPPRDTVVPAPRFIVQFEAVTEEQAAQNAAAAINIGNETARVQIDMVLGIPVYRVVMGPFTTRAEAERIGRASGRSFCVNDGVRCR